MNVQSIEHVYCLSKYLHCVSQIPIRRTARKLKPRSQSFGKIAVFVRVGKPFVVVGYEAVQRDGIFKEKSGQRQDEEKGTDVQLSC